MPIELNAPTSPRIELRPRPDASVRITALRGARGPAGKSAYQSAVDNGFTGTESEWLAYQVNQDDLQAHVNAAEPHPAYDDIPSLTILFENGIA